MRQHLLPRPPRRFPDHPGDCSLFGIGRGGRAILGALIWGMMLLGCARAPSAPRSIPVKGRVMQQGKPLAGVVLTFWPQEQRLQALIKPPSGISESDGTFQISCPGGP